MPIFDSITRRLLRQWLRFDLHKRPGGWTVARNLVKNQSSAPVTMDGLVPVYVDLRGFDLLEVSMLLAAPDEPEFEREDRAVFRKLITPAQVVLDIGANVGYHTALFAALVGDGGRVFAFEPQPGLLPNLRRTVSAMANTTLLECALSDADGEITFHLPEHGYHMLAGMADPGVRSQMVAVKALTLDGLWASGEIAAPDFIKIDVEGAETLVFKGAKAMLDRPDAPLIFFEQWRSAAQRLGFQGTAAADFLLSLPAARYRLFEAAGDSLRPLSENQLEKGNLLAVPQGRLRALDSRV